MHASGWQAWCLLVRSCSCGFTQRSCQIMLKSNWLAKDSCWACVGFRGLTSLTGWVRCDHTVIPRWLRGASALARHASHPFAGPQPTTLQPVYVTEP